MVFAYRLLAAALFAAAPALAGAVTWTEALDAPGGSFSSDWSKPTAVAQGVTRITGTGAQNDFDILSFSGLAPGAQRFDFTFAGPDGAGNSYSAGGVVKFSTEPFRWGWDGKDAFGFQLGKKTLSSAATLALADTFAGGDLFVALYFTHGRLDWTLDAPSNAQASLEAPAAVPLPAAGLMLIAAMAGLAVFRRRA